MTVLPLMLLGLGGGALLMADRSKGKSSGLASAIEQQEYLSAAKQLQNYSLEALKGTKLPDEIVNLPGVSPEMLEQVNDALKKETDPTKLRKLAALLRALPNGENPQIKASANIIDTLAYQLETRKAFLSKVETLKTKAAEAKKTASQALVDKKAIEKEAKKRIAEAKAHEAASKQAAAEAEAHEKAAKKAAAKKQKAAAKAHKKAAAQKKAEAESHKAEAKKSKPKSVGELTTAMKKRIAEILKDLGVDATGVVSGKPTEAAIAAATSFAAELETLGFLEAARQLREYAKIAGQKLTVSDTVTVPGIPKDLQKKINRVIKLERDPKKLRALAAALRKLPNAKDPQVKNTADMLDALASQIEAAQQQASVLDEIDQTLTKKGIPKAKESMPLDFTLPESMSTPAPTPAPTSTAPAPAPTSSSSVTYIVKANDTPYKLAAKYAPGGGSQYKTLIKLNVPPYQWNSKKDNFKQFWAGMKLKWPEGWANPNTGAASAPKPAPTPAPAAPAPTSTSTSTSPAETTYIVKQGDSPYALAVKYAPGGGSQYKQLISLNVPPYKWNAKKDNFQQFWAGMKLKWPEGWKNPNTSVSGKKSMPETHDPKVVQLPAPETKTPVEIAAGHMVSQLNAILRNNGGDVKSARSKVDTGLVKTFQSLAGIKADGKASPATIAMAAQYGQCDLPLVFEWPKKVTQKTVLTYRKSLLAIAKRREAEQLVACAELLKAAAEREKGQAGVRA
jgi:LysM repeat protein